VAGARPAASRSPRPADWSTIRALSTCARPTCSPHLDGWLTGLFHPATLEATLDVLIAASQDASGTAEACARSSGRWPTASASSPATERRSNLTSSRYGQAGRLPVARSFERHQRAENRSERTTSTTTYLIGLRQADISHVPPERAR
jgi:hypothetical protein